MAFWVNDCIEPEWSRAIPTYVFIFPSAFNQKHHHWQLNSKIGMQVTQSHHEDCRREVELHFGCPSLAARKKNCRQSASDSILNTCICSWQNAFVSPCRHVTSPPQVGHFALGPSPACRWERRAATTRSAIVFCS